MTIVLAVGLGMLFGFVLHGVGATNPDRLLDMLRLRDLHLAKSILAGIGIACILLFVGMAVGLVDSGHLSVKSMTWAVIVGGAIFGIGWGICGYCPGTGVAGLGAGRRDAVSFVLGGLLGAGLFAAMYGGLADGVLQRTLFEGKATLAETGQAHALVPGIPGWAVALVVGGVFLAMAFWLPLSVTGGSSERR